MAHVLCLTPLGGHGGGLGTFRGQEKRRDSVAAVDLSGKLIQNLLALTASSIGMPLVNRGLMMGRPLLSGADF